MKTQDLERMPLHPMTVEAEREAERHGFHDRLMNLYDAHAAALVTDDPFGRDGFRDVGILNAQVLHFCDGLPWPAAFDSVIQRITEKPAAEQGREIMIQIGEFNMYQDVMARRALAAWNASRES